jgi:hypothetical protein
MWRRRILVLEQDATIRHRRTLGILQPAATFFNNVFEKGKKIALFMEKDSFIFFGEHEHML